MRRLAVSSLLLGLYVPKLRADEPKPASRPISEAESVLAVYRENHGLIASEEPAIIIAAWSDGFIVWSGDRLKGGAPYRAGRVDPKRVTALLTRLDKDGLLTDESLERPNFGPDSPFTTILVKSGKKQVEMCSWHELHEATDGLVVDHHGVSRLEGRRRLDVMRKAPADYLFYRFVWAETRSKMADLIPGESTASGGKLVMKAGKLSWQEPVVTHTRRP